MTREIETWLSLSDSRVGNNSVVDHRNNNPVIFGHNLCECRPIFEILSLTDSVYLWRKLPFHNRYVATLLIGNAANGVARNFRQGVRQSVAFLSVHSRSAALPSRPYNQKTS